MGSAKRGRGTAQERAVSLAARFAKDMPAAVNRAAKLSADTVEKVRMVNWGALKCMECNLTNGADEMRLLRAAADVSLTLCVGGMGDADDRNVALAGRRVLDDVLARCGECGPFNLDKEEVAALSAMLAMHDAQLASEDMTQAIMLQAMDKAIADMRSIIASAERAALAS